MSHQVLASQTQSPIADSDVKQRSVNISPTIWGDHFLSYAASSKEVEVKLEQHVQELKQEVRRMLMAPVAKCSQKMDIIDKVQRLGISYHFENEINESLKEIQKNSCGSEDREGDGNLYNTALRFRLLRQQGYNVSCNMFDKFKDSKGTFEESLVTDVAGLLSLYEASHLMIHGEDILDDALAFTTTHLRSIAYRDDGLISPLSKQMTHALYQPLWKGFSRIEARFYLSIYEEEDSHNETLLRFAKLDFNLVQKVHQKELSEITRWWKDLNFANKLPFARDRIVESYFWALETCFEPEYEFPRMIICKYVALTTVLNDVYDNYGTYEQLELFTEAIERWDMSNIDQLPSEYLKICYKELLDCYSGYEEKLANDGNLYLIHYARDAIKTQLGAYFERVKWLKAKHIPTMEEYFPVELNAAFFAMAVTSFVGVGEMVTKDTMDWVFSDPKILKATSLIGRLLNDLAGYKFEESGEHDTSAMICYMNQYGVTEEEARAKLTQQMNDAWKDLNEEFINLRSSNIITMPLLRFFLNLARSSEVLYKHEDDVFTRPETVLKDYLVSLFIEPVPM